ncbi:thiolase, N-terminal domain protein [Mycobacterium xenopi 4042]|uniref:Thiolase, N-terminal domain protein n=1 Tax=Mycobacterium xenopi 4042 TaxID=1299334 RepID=X8DLI2_MYCXE|nr:thiolase, N-terminal domain protein [Mycobacterium xenopi 4042]
MRRWLREWVAKATGQSPDAIDESTPMVELGLSSRDAVAMAADIEDRTGSPCRRRWRSSTRPSSRWPPTSSRANPSRSTKPTTRTGHGRAWRPGRHRGGGPGHPFPGDMNTPEETWQALLEGRDAITDPPEGRWSEFLDEPRIAERVAKARTRGGYLKDIKGFDSEFFALSKTEADNIDPQQRMALELTWEALENARIPASSLRGEAVGVFIGVSVNDYSFLAMSDPTVTHPYAITGTAHSIVANRVSYFYDFRGPSVAVDTACSSSLVAAHQAVQALRSGECDVAVAGGVNALITPVITVGFDEVGGCWRPMGGSSRSRTTPTATPARRAPGWWCSSGSRMRAATATRFSR